MQNGNVLYIYHINDYIFIFLVLFKKIHNKNTDKNTKKQMYEYLNANKNNLSGMNIDFHNFLQTVVPSIVTSQFHDVTN
jgi:hypothetical protein